MRGISLDLIIGAFVVFASILLLEPVYSHTLSEGKIEGQTLILAGTTPDSFLYFFDVFFDNIALSFTFDPTEKAKKAVDIARERLLEFREMANKNDMVSAEKARIEQENALGIVESSIAGIEKTNATEEIVKKIEIEIEIEEHEFEIDGVEAEIKIKVSPASIAIAESNFEKLKIKLGEVKIEIENAKNKTKAKIKLVTNKTEEEVDDEIEKIEEDRGLDEVKREKALEQINEAREEIAETKEKALTINITINRTAYNQLISLAEEHLESAENAFNESKFGEAYGQAKSAESLAENAGRILEKEEDRRGEEPECEADTDCEAGKVCVEGECKEQEEEFEVKVLEAPNKVEANETFEITWRVESNVAKTITHTAIHYDFESHEGDYGIDMKPADSGYPNLITDFASGSFEIPKTFTANITATETGKLYFRAHAIIDDKNYWSDEESLEVKEKPQTTKKFTIEADDVGFYPNGTIIVKKGDNVEITFKVKQQGVYYGGLDFRSDYFTTSKVSPGGLTKVNFTAEESFEFSSYWPSSGVKKADGMVIVLTDCDWRPTKDYGVCDAVLGSYYDGEKCVWVSGCSSGDDVIPFDSINSCKSLCE